MCWDYGFVVYKWSCEEEERNECIAESETGKQWSSAASDYGLDLRKLQCCFSIFDGNSNVLILVLSANFIFTSLNSPTFFSSIILL